MRILKDVKTAGFSSMGVGGKARAYLEVESKSQLGHVWKEISNGEYFCLGGGTNTVFGDYFDGLIFKLKGEFQDIKAMGTQCVCGGGAVLSKVCAIAQANNLSGLEGLSQIPGTVGGGVFGNCGAFGKEIADVIDWVEVVTKSGEMRISKSMCGFGYRKSVLPKNCIITKVAFKLENSTMMEIRAKQAQMKTERNSTQPMWEKSCGCVFKKVGEISPAKLIEEAGLKGYRVGGLEVSKKHAGFIVNVGGGTPRDFIKITADITDTIYEKYRVKLEKEVKFIGKANKI